MREPDQLGVERAHPQLAFGVRLVQLAKPDRHVAADDDRRPPVSITTTCMPRVWPGAPTRALTGSRDSQTGLTQPLGSGRVIGLLVAQHEFAEAGGVTNMRITQAYESEEFRDGAIASGMGQGMETCYQQLEPCSIIWPAAVGISAITRQGQAKTCGRGSDEPVPIASCPRHRAQPRLVSSTPRSGVRRGLPRIRVPRPA